jgi:pimeloyl-ACP methyl ester carboxylesterase
MPNVTWHEIPRCGHMPLIEQPAETIRLVEAHLAEPLAATG